MVRWPRVARLAVGQAGVVEGDVLPVAGVAMAVAATAGIVVGGRGVALRAVGPADLAVVEAGVLPVAGVTVATGAAPGKVVGRRGVACRTVGAANRAAGMGAKVALIEGGRLGCGTIR